MGCSCHIGHHGDPHGNRELKMTEFREILALCVMDLRCLEGTDGPDRGARFDAWH